LDRTGTAASPAACPLTLRTLLLRHDPAIVEQRAPVLKTGRGVHIPLTAAAPSAARRAHERLGCIQSVTQPFCYIGRLMSRCPRTALSPGFPLKKRLLGHGAKRIRTPDLLDGLLDSRPLDPGACGLARTQKDKGRAHLNAIGVWRPVHGLDTPMELSGFEPLTSWVRWKSEHLPASHQNPWKAAWLRAFRASTGGPVRRRLASVSGRLDADWTRRQVRRTAAGLPCVHPAGEPVIRRTL
jgi:hypothetical protein